MVALSQADINVRKQKWFKNRLRLSTAVRRSTEISDVAYRVWAELAFGWAWNEPTCFPTYALLSEALSASRSTIYRAILELEEHGLVEKKRLPKGNKYLLVADIPPKFNTDKLNNKALAARVRRQQAHHEAEPPLMILTPHDDEGPLGDVSDLTPQDQESEVSPVTPSHVSDLTPQGCDEDSNWPENHPSHVSDLTPKVDEVHLLDVHPDKKKYRKGKERREPAALASGTIGGTRASGNEGSEGDEMAEAEDLLSEPEAIPVSRTTRRKKVKQRHASADLVSRDDLPRSPFPEALGSSQANAKVSFDPQPPPPPVETPEEVLLLLRGEMETRWGQKGIRGFALELSGKLRGQITNCILRKYPPDVILSMVRLLVWDWEVARGACFPFKKDVQFPTAEAFAQYAEGLASRVESGFVYPSERRGALNTYHDLFIRKIPYLVDDDPF